MLLTSCLSWCMSARLCCMCARAVDVRVSPSRARFGVLLLSSAACSCLLLRAAPVCLCVCAEPACPHCTSTTALPPPLSLSLSVEQKSAWKRKGRWRKRSGAQLKPRGGQNMEDNDRGNGLSAGHVITSGRHQERQCSPIPVGIWVCRLTSVAPTFLRFSGSGSAKFGRSTFSPRDEVKMEFRRRVSGAVFARPPNDL